MSKPDTIQQIHTELARCEFLVKIRNKKWGDAWREYSLEALVVHGRAKLQRALNCMQQGGDEDDVVDSLRDGINYCIFALVKLTEKIEGS